MKVLVSFIPVLLFLVLLISLDSFRLLRWHVLIVCLLWGVVSASISLLINNYLGHSLHVSFAVLSQYIAPFVEEALKLLILLWLVFRHRIGFSIDAAIYGFAVGTGFALTENLVYILELAQQEPTFWTWMIRGFGTAVMHGGVTAIAAMILVNRLTIKRHLALPFILALMVAYLLHAFYNADFIPPKYDPFVMTVVVAGGLVGLFRLSEKNLIRWLDLGMDSEVALLHMIRKGTFTQTTAGAYLLSVKNQFPKTVVLDMLCFIELYLELSVKAKALMMLKEQNLPLPMDPDIREKLTEIEHLRKRLGTSAMLALNPVLRMNRNDLWALDTLKPEKQG
jgi:protease PrsW